jgi:formate dehydrogenase iron-sulfur subunit
VPEAQLFGADPDGGTGGAGAFFLLLDEPEVYGFPPDPIVTTADLPRMWKHAAMAAVGLFAAAVTVFAGRRG